MDPKLIHLKKLIPNRDDFLLSPSGSGVPFEVKSSIYTAMWVFEDDSKQGGDERQQNAVTDLEKKLRELMENFNPNQLESASTLERKVDCYWLSFDLFCNPNYEGKPDKEDAAAMILLLAESLLEEISEPDADHQLAMGICVKIGRTEGFLASLFGLSPMIAMPSFEQKIRARWTGRPSTWYRQAVIDVLATLEPGLKPLQARKALCSMDNVPHPLIKSFERRGADIIVYPVDEKIEPEIISYGAFRKYPRP